MDKKRMKPGRILDKDIGEQISIIHFQIEFTLKIKPTKSSLSFFYDIGEQISIVKSPNVNPTKLTLTPVTLSNPPNQSTPVTLSNPPNQSTPAILSNPSNQLTPAILSTLQPLQAH
ncbi:unnamed protein product [Rhizophagus irregularis]|nr:unnamed protein product [Rhizophagus irregularis]CAB5099328.1 unnamed protein product [Rhizophagus irregularis]